MADQNVSLVYVDLFTFYQSVDRIIVRKIISILVCASDQLTWKASQREANKNSPDHIHPGVPLSQYDLLLSEAVFRSYKFSDGQAHSENSSHEVHCRDFH